MTNRAVSIFLLLTLAAATVTAAPARVALTNATLLDPGRAVHQEKMTILIEGERISAVFPTGSRPLPLGTTIRDVAGRYVLPGFIDSHTHLTPIYNESPGRLDRELERMLRGGVVATRDMAGNSRIVGAAIREIRSGRKLGPDVVFATVMGGPSFMEGDPRVRREAAEFGPGKAPWAQTVSRETDVVRAVARASDTGASALKLYIEIDRELMRALADEARRRGMKVWSHATVYPERPIDVVRAGVDTVSHLCGLAWQDADLDPAKPKGVHADNRPRVEWQRVEAESAEMKELFDEMVRRGTILDATLSNHLRTPNHEFGCQAEMVVALAKAAHRAGVTFSAGTDYAAPPSDPYPALHIELEQLVSHGVLTPAEALVAATRTGARALGLENDYGAIEPGKLASLVILQDDPTRDIRAVRTVVHVMKRGVIYDGPPQRDVTPAR